MIEVKCYSAGTGSGNYILSGTYPDPPAGLPDLVITNMSVSNQYPPTNSNINVAVTVENQGTENAGGFYLDLFYNLSAPPTQGMYGNELFQFSGLNAGQQVTATFTNIYNSIPERWFMYAYVDTDNFITESNEDNNVYGPSEAVWMCPSIQNYYPWPLSPNNVAHQINSVLDEPRYTTTTPHFHDGVDIQGTQSTKIFTVSSGIAQVTSNGVYVNSAAGTFFYYHLQNIPSGLHGETLTCFEKIGETDGYNHLHFNDGANNSEINPLRPNGITPQAQTPTPTIQDVWFIENENPNNVYPVHVWGNFDIIAKINGWSPPNAYRMGVYKVGYSIDSTDPNDVVWTFQFDNWINGNPSNWAYYEPEGPHDPHPGTLGHIFRVTNGPNNDGYLNFDNSIWETINIYVWAEDTYGRQTNAWYQIVIVPTGIEDEEDNNVNIPDEFNLSGNYPNPFNPETIIKYQIPVNSFVKINIYNILGQKVKNLMNAHQIAGYYSVKWNGSNNNGIAVSSGVYIVRMEAIANNTKAYEAKHKVNLIK